MGNSFETTSLIRFGFLFIFLTIGGFLLWVMNAPLSSASLAEGKLVVESQRKKVQHLEGGQVKAIYVKEGDRVKAGDVLMAFSNSKAESDYHRLFLHMISLQAQHDRLDADLNNQKTITWNAPNTEEIEPTELSNILSSHQLQHQQAILQKGLREAQYKQQRRSLEEQRRGIRFQLQAVKRQMDLVNQEVDMTRGLSEKGFVSKTRLLELQRHQARIDAQQAELNVDIDGLSRQLVALEQSFTSEAAELTQEVTAQLGKIEKELRDVKQALAAARDVRSRVVIRSEHSGTVVGLNVHSVGGVVNAGDVIMEIVPDSDELIVEALIKPEDIDSVYQGQSAKVRLSAYNIRRIQPVSGEVVHVAADLLLPKRANQQPGYLVKVKLNSMEIQQLSDVKLYPGMPTEVFILLEEQTVWDYLTEPLLSSYYRSFRES